MALRNATRIVFNLWRGLNTSVPKENLDPQSWFDSLNVIVNNDGHLEALRSPKAFGTALVPFDDSDSDSSPSASGSASSASSPSDSNPDDGPILSMDEYNRTAGHVLVIDRGGDTFYLPAAGGAPVGIRSDQAGDPWVSLNIDNKFYRIDGNEFIQFLTDFSYYRVGIDPPASTPVLSYVEDDLSDSFSDSGSEATIQTSIQGSYAYRNSETGHVSAPSPISNILGPSDESDSDSGLLNTLRMTVVASTQPGVDQIVLFLTVDGGTVPSLVIDCDTLEMATFNNATGNIDLPIASIEVDTLTPEPIYNAVPTSDSGETSFMFTWKDRIVLCDGRGVRYSGYESCYVGVPWESWPPLNQINIPNRSDTVIGGVSTQVGALIQGREDSYLLSGYPSDKTSSPNNPIAITEHMEPLNWKLGTLYPRTTVNTQYGVIWVDQHKRIQNWNMQGFPVDIGAPLTTELEAMGENLQARWFNHGTDGGIYVVTDGTTLLFITIYTEQGGKEILFGYGKSDIAADAMATVKFETAEEFFIGKTDQIYQILDPDLEGDGWPVGTRIFFKVMMGNTGNFTYLHSVRLDGSLNGLTLEVSRPDEVDPQDVLLESEDDTGESVYGLVDGYGRRLVLNFEFAPDDQSLRVIENFQAFFQNKNRII